MSKNKFSNYTKRWAHGVAIAGMPVLNTYWGNVWWVDSGSGSDQERGKGTVDRPFATIDYAIGRCTANNNDIIMVAAGHAETLASAGAITADVVGVSIIGMGTGTDRPQLTLTDTASTIIVSAANVTFENIHFINDVDSLVVGIPVTAAHCLISNCLFDDATAAKQTLHWITGSAAADYLEIAGCENHGSDTAGSTGFVTLAAADHVKIVGNISHGDFSAANIIMTAACTDCLIEDNRLQNANAVDVCIEGFAAATGWVAHNLMFIATDTILTSINTVGALALFENYHVNVGGETGILVGTPSA